MTISFSTVIYEGNYKKVLLSDFIPRNILKIGYEFDKKYFFINNVQDKSSIASMIGDLFPDFEYFFTEYNNFEVLKSFNLSRQKLTPGFIYSIAHFQNIHRNPCNFNFHLSSDCEILEFDNKFFDESVKLLENDDRILVTMPSWDRDAPTLEKLFEIDNFYIERGFTDQTFFCKISDFKKDIYDYWHEESNRYPPYGKNSFERRIDSYMWCENKYRAVSKTTFYKHGA